MKFDDASDSFYGWFFLTFAIFVILGGYIDGDVQTDNNYGKPLHLPLIDAEPIEVELTTREIRLSKHEFIYSDIYLFRLNGETFECNCNAFWCKEGVRRQQKIIRFRKVAVRFAEGTIRRKIFRGTRFCQIEDWEFWNPADEALIRQWSEQGKGKNP